MSIIIFIRYLKVNWQEYLDDGDGAGPNTAAGGNRTTTYNPDKVNTLGTLSKKNVTNVTLL